jgi:hypothetical protein
LLDLVRPIVEENPEMPGFASPSRRFTARPIDPKTSFSNIKSNLQSLTTQSDGAAGQVAALAAELAKHVQELEGEVDKFKADVARLKRR